jgi:hypothetical protein
MPTNKRPATCEHCGLGLAPGEGFVFRVAGGDWHIVCNYQLACHARAKKAVSTSRPKLSPEELRAAVHAAMVRLEVARELEAFGGISRHLRRRGVTLLRRCVLRFDGDIFQFIGPGAVVEELAAEPLAWALRSVAAKVLGQSPEELSVEFVAEVK